MVPAEMPDQCGLNVNGAHDRPAGTTPACPVLTDAQTTSVGTCSSAA
jgi:hypothetical protein